MRSTAKCKLGRFADDSIVCNRISLLGNCELLLNNLEILTTCSKKRSYVQRKGRHVENMVKGVRHQDINFDEREIISVTKKKNLIKNR